MERPKLIPHIPAGYDWDDDVELVVALDDETTVPIVEFFYIVAGSEGSASGSAEARSAPA